MVPIGVASTLIPTDGNASETNTVLPSAKDGTTFANAVKRPLSFSPEIGAKKMYMGVVAARQEHTKTN